MKRGRLGNLFVMPAMIGGLAEAMRATAPRSRSRSPIAPGKRIMTQADVDASDRADAKRARKAAKLRRDHERDH